TDPAGNVSGPSAVLSVRRVTAGAAPANLAVTPTSDSGTKGDGITNVALPTLTGTGENGATVTLLDGSTTLGTGAVAGGAWSITIATPLTAGTHAITATQTDVA